jgi:hypothetical protein
MIPEAVDVTNVLSEGLGNDEDAMRAWWHTPRDELGGYTPRAWLIGGGQVGVVIDRARDDVAAAIADARA